MIMRCKNCKIKFEPTYFNEKYCKNDECKTVEVQKLLEKKRKADKRSWNKEKKERKERLKTRSDHLKEVQTVFNKFIRLRDKGNNCISCGKPCKKENAGHYRSVGGNPELRFEELNCHLQCEYCNTYLHGNLIEYRKGLIKKIGVELVEWLEGVHELKKYTIQELKDLKEYYKDKIKEL